MKGKEQAAEYRRLMGAEAADRQNVRTELVCVCWGRLNGPRARADRRRIGPHHDPACPRFKNPKPGVTK